MALEQFEQKECYTIQDLLEIIRLLRDPQNGCPWDKVQTHESIRMNFVEETYEVLDAIDLKDPHLLCEELGDVMMQVALHCRMEEEQGHFGFEEVCDGVCRKLIFRHPHIFTAPNSAEQNLSADQVLNTWDLLKNKEKSRLSAADELESVPAALPALMRAGKTQKRAARYGFAGQSAPQAFDSLDAQTAALRGKTPGTPETAAAVGDLLFSAVAAARSLGVDPEDALAKATSRFAAGVVRCEQLAPGRDLAALAPEERKQLWTHAHETLAAEEQP